MLSKNNLQERLRKMEPKKNHYSIRKFTVGVASVLIGMTFMEMSNGQTVKADTVTPQVRDQETQVSQEKNSTASELSKNANISTQQEANKQDAVSFQKVNEQNAKNKTEETGKTSPLNDSVNSAKTEKTNSTNEVSPQSSNNTSVTSKSVTVDSNKVVHTPNSKKDNKINSTISNKVEEDLSENKVIKPSTNIKKSESTTLKIDPSKTTTGLKASLQSPEITNKKLQELIKTALFAKSSEEENITDATNYPDTNGIVPEDQYIFNQFHLTRSLTTDNLTPDGEHVQSFPLVITLATDRNNPGHVLHYYITDDDYTKQNAIGGDILVNQSYSTNDGVTIYNFGEDGISVNSSYYGLAYIFGYGKGAKEFLKDPYNANNVSRVWGDAVPKKITHTVSYINENTGKEMPGMPQIVQTGLTGQNYNVFQVNKEVIDGYYLTNSSVAQGTLSQFKKYGTSTRKWVDESGNTIYENWYQLDNEGLMQLTVNVTSQNGNTTQIVNKKVVEPDGSVSYSGSYGEYQFTNPYVPSTADIKLLYAPVGRIIPVDKDGNEIPNASQPRYTNDPYDATNVTPNEPVPTVSGYTPSVSTVTPTDPGTDTPVIYNPVIEKGSVIVTVHDNTDNVDLPKYGYNSGEENVGSKVDFNKSQTITELTNKGYNVINPDVVIPTEITKGPNTVTIYVEHTTTTVKPDKPGTPGEPINPNDPEGPKYPEGTDRNSLIKTGTQTVHYVGAGDKTPSDKKQSFDFTRSITFDNVTGKIINTTAWNATSHKFGYENTPLVDGYHADRRVAGGTTVTPDDLNKTVIVNYNQNGKIVPVDPEGNPIPNVPTPTYPTDPSDPTKVVPNEPVPNIPGMTPSTPTVTPADPGTDTPVIYNPVIEKGSVIVTVHDNTDKVDLPKYGYNSGEENVGSKVDFNKSQTITELTNKGYKVINPDVVIPTEITKGSNTVTIYVEHTTTTVNPDKPGTPGEPINPNDPEGPKYPEGTDKNSLIKTGTQTVHYVGAGDKTPSDKKQSFDFTRSITFDNVTGKIINTTAWNATSHKFGYENTPLVDGYHADRRVAGGTTVTPDDLNKTVIVNYNQNGKIVPVDPEGNPIPNVPKPTYPTDPSDPTKVVPNEPVPNIPGMTPSTPTVTPADPGTDTQVIYNPVIEKGSVIVTVHDNTAKVDLPQYGYNSGEENVGSKVDFNKSQTITELTNKGYKVINPDVVIPTEITKGSNTVTIYVEHTTTTVNPDKPGTPGEPINPNDPEGPKYPEGTDKNSLIKTGTQTVHYVGAGDKTPSDKKQSFDFTRSITFDNVTGKIINTTAWNATSHKFGYENTPLVDGYHADRRVAGGTTVTPDDLNKTVIVNYNQNGKIVPVDPEGNPIPNVPTPTYPTDPSDPTKVTPNEPVPNIPGMTPSTPTVTPADPGTDTQVIYNPVIEKGSVIVTVHDNTANVDLPKYGYNSGEENVGSKVDFNKSQTITELTNKGYKVINPDVVIPTEITKGSNTVTIYVEHTTTTVNPDKPGTPGEPINPNDPEGPKYPEGTDKNSLIKTGTQTVHYVGAGDKTPSDKKQSFDFTRSITFDNVTGKIINTTAWNATSHKFGYENTPLVDGYHADRRVAGGTTVTPDDLNKTVIVNYNQNGKIVPVDPEGNPIPNVPKPTYPTDPSDPTKVVPNEPVPNIPGMTPSTPTVTPADPGTDTQVIYNPVIEKGSVIVTVHDNTAKVDLPQYGYNSGEENVGSKVDFNKSQTITELTNKGYKVINPDVVIPTEITKGSNTVTIYVEHTTTTVNPDKPGTPGEPINPNDPEGPKYPEGTDKNSLIKTGTQTVHYVGAGDKTPSDKKQSFDFTRSITFDNVTGKIINTTAWNATSHKFGYENTPLVDGYHADRRVAGGTTVTPDDLNKTVIVNYNQNGKIVPVDPEGNPIPNVPTPTYPTDPSDPTKVTPNEPVPNIPGMTPSTPTVTPADPGTDTQVIYNPVIEKGSVIVTVHDNTANVDLPKYGYNSGEENVGSKVDFNKSQTITELTNKGYKVINPDVVIPTEITKGSNTVTIYVEHTTTTVNPDKPGTPGEPINPNDPEGPKYPEGTDKNSLIKTGTQTVHYVGAGDKTPSDKKQSFDFTRSITFDNVTGKIINTTAWNATSHKFGYENTPLVDGYHADRRVAGGTTVTPDDLNKTVIVNYNQNGKIVPVDPEGNPIPNVPKPTYPTDPSDPTKVTPNEPVPNIPGMTPSTPTVTPADPGTDTPVSYTPVENPTPEEPLPTTIEGTQTIKFETEDGTQLESPNVQKAQFTGSHTFGKVNVPVIPGYIATQTTAGGLTVTESKPNVGQTVIYKKIGKIIPIDSNGNPIPNANQPQYTNDPTNPTKVVPNESVPDVPGYTPESSTVTPVDPTTDTPVVYKKDEIPRKPITSHKSDKETPSRPKEETSNRPKEETSNRPKEETSSRPKGETSENYESALTTANNTNAKGENAKSNIGRAKAAAHQNTLPQTGEKDTEIAGLAGLALMAVAGMISLLGGKDRKRKKN